MGCQPVGSVLTATSLHSAYDSHIITEWAGVIRATYYAHDYLPNIFLRLPEMFTGISVGSIGIILPTPIPGGVGWPAATNKDEWLQMRKPEHFFRARSPEQTAAQAGVERWKKHALHVWSRAGVLGLGWVGEGLLVTGKSTQTPKN
jgi:hypothetical protein